MSESALGGTSIARLIRVEGRVQGVFFRDWTQAEARTLALTGWVRNRRDGSVEVLAIGRADAMAQLIERLHEGPPAARVDRVTQSEATVEPMEGFTRAPTA